LTLGYGVTLSHVNAEQHIARLERSVQGLLGEIERLPADVLYREPRTGEWPVMSTLAHLAELMPYWAHQAAEVARSPGNLFGRTHEDPLRLGAIEQHGRDSLEAMVPRIRAALADGVATLRTIPNNAWGAQAHHPTRGTRSVEQIVTTYIVDHAEEHASQIKATLQALQATPRT
jgi:uncharacterized damage-inducible protein DinB